MNEIYYFHQRYIESFGKNINKICTPFFAQNGISYFLYVKVTKAGSLVILNTNPKFSENYLDLGFFNDDVVMTHPENINTDALIWSSTLSIFPIDEEYTSYHKVMDFCSKKFNYDHGLALFRKKHNFCETFFFATHPENSNIIDSYITDLNKYKLFSKYFLLEASKYIKKAEQCPINIVNVKKDFFEDRKIKLINYKDGLSSMIYKILNHYGLTQAESNCLTYCSQVLTAKEIGSIQKISSRTVESHLQSVKEKLNIYSKSRLIRWYREYLL